jgi:hypothetical protein
MRWDVLQLNEKGASNDGSNFVPDVSSGAVKGADISKVMIDALDKNIKALEESHNAITKVWQDAKKAQDSAQTLFDEASNQFGSRKRSMETGAEKSAGAEAMCSKANNAVTAANGALAQATSDSKTVSASVDKEIEIIMHLKGKLTEVRSLVCCFMLSDSRCLPHSALQRQA